LLIDFGKPFKLSVWDFSGDPFYLNTIHHFLDAKALYLLTFDLSTYRTGDFQDTFAFWLDYVVARNNEVSCKIRFRRAGKFSNMYLMQSNKLNKDDIFSYQNIKMWMV